MFVTSLTIHSGLPTSNNMFYLRKQPAPGILNEEENEETSQQTPVFMHKSRRADGDEPDKDNRSDGRYGDNVPIHE